MVPTCSNKFFYRNGNLCLFYWNGYIIYDWSIFLIKLDPNNFHYLGITISINDPYVKTGFNICDKRIVYLSTIQVLRETRERFNQLPNRVRMH